MPDPMTLAVVVTSISDRSSKRTGSEFARLTIEDFSGSAEVIVFPEKWSVLVIRSKRTCRFSSRAAIRGATRTLTIRRSSPSPSRALAELRANGQVMISIELAKDASLDPQEALRDVQARLSTPFPGAVPLEINYCDGNGLRARLRSRSLTLAVNSTALNDLRSLLGIESVRLQRGSKYVATSGQPWISRSRSSSWSGRSTSSREWRASAR